MIHFNFSGYPCPKFKIIILDECDSMTPDAQSALRRIMETYAKVTRFCLICNYVTRVIEPLASRCAKFRFKPLPVYSMIERISSIATAENVQLASGALDSILEASGGDMRKAVTYLQSSHQLTGGGIITSDLITEISGQVPINVLEKLWQTMTNGLVDPLRKVVVEIIAQGYPIVALLTQLHDQIIANTRLTDVDKSLLSEKIAIVRMYSDSI